MGPEAACGGTSDPHLTSVPVSRSALTPHPQPGVEEGWQSPMQSRWAFPSVGTLSSVLLLLF